MGTNLDTWHFGTKNDELVELVLTGKKTATTSIYTELDEYEKVGDSSILLYANERKACVTKTESIIITEFKNITWELAKLEGENNSLEEWKKEHHEYFKSIDTNFNENTKVIFETFSVIKNFVEERLEICKKICKNNEDVIGCIDFIKEINSGFTNYVFNVGNKFVIKVCSQEENEDSFTNEYNFYEKNRDNIHVPKLLKYDNSKMIVSFVYEIIEYINGNSIYYYWYKWNEDERKIFIKDLMDVVKEIHHKKYSQELCQIDINRDINDAYEECQSLFNIKEKNVVECAIKKCKLVMQDNIYSLIHNDLHFDNIIIDENDVIKIIDFNESLIGPFDYDLRILYMCQSVPWKWADSKMDPYQKKEDYKNLFNYVKEYYQELSTNKYLEQRMLLYAILNDLRNLKQYKSQELKVAIINNSKRVVFLTNNEVEK